METKRIAIIGAGCSGLVAIKSCLEEKLLPVCFERENDIGGLWNYTEEPILGKGSIYKNLVINTSKEMMAFSDFPPPSEFPPFMPHSDVLKYFRMYAENFQLLPYIRFQTSVIFIKQATDYESSGRWVVTYQKKGHESQEEIFDAVVVCSGHHTVPHIPDFKGIEEFEGTIIHSHSYREANRFKNQKVAVVGIGNSAVDIAVDLAKVADQVFTSTRRGAWVIGRTGVWGIPADLIANNRFLFSLPHSILQWFVEKQANLRIDHQLYGLQPEHGALEAHPTINDEMPFSMMSGKIRIKPDVSKITKKGILFKDGTFEQVDAIILATGYNYQLKFVDEKVLKIINNKVELFQFVFPPDLKHPTFGVIGLIQAIGAVMPISEIQSRWFVQLIKGNLTLPSRDAMWEDIDARNTRLARSYVKSKRHTIQAFWVEYMDRIASYIDCKPEFFKTFIRDPELALRCHFGPCVPAQYRLGGPHSWSGARPIIINAVSRATNKPIITQPASKNGLQFETPKLMTLLVLLCAFVAWLTKGLI